jgi:citrate synthase
MYGGVGKVDQRGFVNPPRAAAEGKSPAFLSGSEAAALLGIKRETLYAYASRGLVRSEPAGKGRERRYRRDDLLRLKARHDARSGHGPVAAGALQFGEPVLASALTAVDGGNLRYRGHFAVALAEATPYEAVAELLWSGALPASPPAWSAPGIGLSPGALAALLPRGAHPLATLALAVPALAAADPGRLTPDTASDLARARVLILRLASLLGFADDGSRAEAAVASGRVAAAVLLGLGKPASPRAVRAVNQALVLLADHELNASAFAVRVAASARADLYACLSAGLAAASGPLHGGSCDRVEAVVRDAARAPNSHAFVRDRLRRGEALPGLSHPLYPNGDPRTAPLLRAAVEIAPRSTMGGSRPPNPRRASLRTLLDVLAAAEALGAEAPTVDFGLVALCLALGLPRGTAASLFAIGRTAGWVAHTLEQREAGFLLRPRARYVGP